MGDYVLKLEAGVVHEDNKPAEIVKVEKRGRPRGSKNKSPGFHHYVPKRWEPWMDSLVLAKIAGASNKDLAESFEITVAHVSNILSTTEANLIKLKVRKEILEKSEELSDKLTQIRDLSAKRMLEALQNDTLATNSPLSMASLAKELFKIASPAVVAENTAKQVTNNIAQQNILVANPEYVNRIEKGLTLSNEIQERRLQLVANDK